MNFSLLFIKFCVISSIVTLSNLPLISQSQWVKKIDLGRYDSPNALIHGDSLSFYISHRSDKGGGVPITQNLTKISTDGEELWNLKFENDPYNVYEGRAAKLLGSDLIVSYLFDDTSGLEYQIFGITPEGSIKWNIRLPRIIHLEIDYAFELYKIIPLSQNDIRLYFRMNYYWDFDSPSAKNGFISLDSLGQEKYREYFDTGGEYQWPYNMVQSSDTNYLRVYRPTLGSLELLLRYELLDKSYNELWSFEMGPQVDGAGGPSCIDVNGNVYFTWNYDTTGNGGSFDNLPSIISLDPQGGFRWMNHFGEDRGIPVFYDIISTTDGRIIACGQEGNAQLSGGKYRTGWIVCVDTAGNKLWERRYVLEETSSAGNNFYYVIESSDGGLVLFGIKYQVGSSDVYVLKTDYFGCLTENCDLYNFASFITDTEDVIESNNLFHHYINNSILNLMSTRPLPYNIINYDIVNLSGNIIGSGKLDDGNPEISLFEVTPGIYFIRIYEESGSNISIIKFFIP